MPKITILTCPLKHGYFEPVYLKLRKIYHKVHNTSNYGGHPAVTRSLIEGFNKIGFKEFNYLPHNINQIAPHVHVLAGTETLKYALQLKQKGIIKKLTAGPNIVTFSNELNGLVANRNIDLYLQPSKWCVDLQIRLNSSLKDRCKVWPAGIDLEKFVPDITSVKKQVLIYHKNESNQFCYRIEKLVKKYGYQTKIIKYGSYKHDEYIGELMKSKFMVCISDSESQGLFLSEAWAMDVPTLCFDPCYYHFKTPFDLEINREITSCPYLTECTGLRFYEMSELELILKDYDKYECHFKPRSWVEKNLSDEICARKFLDLMEINYE